jgi:hypothetical protein
VLAGVTNVNQFCPAGNDEASDSAGRRVSGLPKRAGKTDQKLLFFPMRFLLPFAIFSIILQLLTKG